jgi:hypothetical protein
MQSFHRLGTFVTTRIGTCKGMLKTGFFINSSATRASEDGRFQDLVWNGFQGESNPGIPWNWGLTYSATAPHFKIGLNSRSEIHILQTKSIPDSKLDSNF